MALRTPDLASVLVADLPRGRLASRSDARLVALPAECFDALAEHHAAAAEALGASLVPLLVADAKSVLADTEDPAPEDVGHALSVAFATRGLGLTAFERWGDALLLVWKNPPGRSAAFRALGATLAARVVGALTGLDVQGAVVSPAGESGDALHVLLASAEVCTLARELSGRGQTLGALLDRLSPGDSP